MTKKELGDLVALCYEKLGQDQTVKLLDEIKELGFEYATMAGHHGFDRRHVDPEGQNRDLEALLQGSGGNREPVQEGYHHRRRTLQQGHRHLDPHDR